MMACEQTAGMSVLQHGMSVHEFFCDLRSHVMMGTPLALEWRLPEWATNPLLWNRLLSGDAIREYQLFHDAGKPYCLVVDAEGGRHFPNHAHVTEQIWRDVGGDPQVATLMGMDMDVHLLKDVGVAEFAGRPEASTLLLTGLAEIHSNATMFGGIESVSFKSKWKQLNRRGKAIVRALNQA